MKESALNRISPLGATAATLKLLAVDDWVIIDDFSLIYELLNQVGVNLVAFRALATFC